MDKQFIAKSVLAHFNTNIEDWHSELKNVGNIPASKELLCNVIAETLILAVRPEWVIKGELNYLKDEEIIEEILDDVEGNPPDEGFTPLGFFNYYVTPNDFKSYIIDGEYISKF